MRENYSIELVSKGDDVEFLKALKIYNSVTPIDIKTDTKDIIYWIEHKSKGFKINIFKVYCNGHLIGLTMTTYLFTPKVMILEYISVKDEYRKNVVYLSCLNLLGQYFIEEKTYSINYWLTDINNKNNGKESDSESQMLTTILDLEGYKKVEACFTTPDLGLTDIPGFEAYFMIKSVDKIQTIPRSTYQGIIKAIYYDYYLPWYSPLLLKDDLTSYQNNLNNTFQKLEKRIMKIHDPISVIDTGYKINDETTGHTPITNISKYTTLFKTIGIYLVTAIFTISIGAFLGLFIITYKNDITDKGAVIAATIAATTTIPVLGIFFNFKIKEK